ASLCQGARVVRTPKARTRSSGGREWQRFSSLDLSVESGCNAPGFDGAARGLEAEGAGAGETQVHGRLGTDVEGRKAGWSFRQIVGRPHGRAHREALGLGARPHDVE